MGVHKRTYAEEFYRLAVMLPADRKGGLEKYVISAFTLSLLLLFMVGKGIYKLFCFGMAKAREEKIKEECLNKFKNDIKLTNYVIFYKVLDSDLSNKYKELSMKVNFIAYNSEKEDLCISDRRLQEVMKYLGYDLRLVRGQYLHEENRKYVFTTDEELDYMATLLSRNFGVKVQFKGYN